MTRRVDYAGSVHDEREIDAVVAVLRGGPQALRIGKHVRAFEQGIAELFGKRRGVMCNSGSSALYLAVELLGLQPGDEIITSAVTFSTDIAPIVRAGLVPVFVDVEPDTYNVDVDAIEAMIGPRTRAILVPNLIGNVPDWDRIRAIADAHGLQVIEDSCDALGSTLRGTPTGTRSDISVTSFALSHIITAAGTGGMVCLDDDDLVDRCLLLRRWGRRSETQIYGSRQGRRPALLLVDRRRHRIRQPLHLRRGRLELRAVGAVRRVRTRAARASSRTTSPPRKHNFDRLTDAVRAAARRVRAPPNDARGRHRLAHVPGAHPARVRRRPRRVPSSTWNATASTPAWSGPATRCASPRSRTSRTAHPRGGLPNADRVMEQGLILPSNHSLDDDDIDYIWATAEAVLP